MRLLCASPSMNATTPSSRVGLARTLLIVPNDSPWRRRPGEGLFERVEPIEAVEAGEIAAGRTQDEPMFDGEGGDRC